MSVTGISERTNAAPAHRSASAAAMACWFEEFNSSARTRCVSDDRNDPVMQLCCLVTHQTHAAQPADGGADAGGSDLARSILKGAGEHRLFRFTREVHDFAEFDICCNRESAVRPSGYPPRVRGARCRRGDKRSLLIAPTPRSGRGPAALGTLGGVVPGPRWTMDLHTGDPPAMPFESGPMRATTRPQSRGSTSCRPGRHILTMTMLIFTALSVTREIERGTETCCRCRSAVEVMFGKISYVNRPDLSAT